MRKFLLPLNLQFFSNSEGSGETSSETTTETPIETNTEQPKTFTQDELNDIIEKRIQRERQKFADYDELKSKVDTFSKDQEERRIADLSEKERLEELLKKSEEEKQQTLQLYETVQNQLKQDKIANAFIKEATKNKVEYIDAALKLADLSSIEVTDEGIKGIEELVKGLVESNPFLVKEAKTPRIIGEANNPNPAETQRTKEQLLAEAAERAKRTGKVEDKAAYAKLKVELGL